MVKSSVSFNGILGVAGNAYASNAANTMITTSLGFVRAGTIPFDKKTTEDEKAQAITWSISSAILSLATQLTVYKGMEKWLEKISSKFLKFDKFENEVRQLGKHLPIDQVDDYLKTVKNTTPDNAVKNGIKEVINKELLDGIEQGTKKYQTNEKIAQQLVKNLDELAKKANITGAAKDISKSVLKKVKHYKGGFQALTYVFGVALFTGYVIPSFVCNKLGDMIKFAHKNVKINDKPILPKLKDKKEKDNNKQQSLWLTLGAPLAAATGILATLRYKKFDFSKGLGKIIQNKFARVAELEHKHMDPTNIVLRNIGTNAVLRSASALIQGRPFLAAYNFVMEGISGASLLASKKFLKLGNPKKPQGIVKWTAEKLKIKNPKDLKGLDFIMTHTIQTYGLLGLALGVVTNKISKPLSDFMKKHIGTKDEDYTPIEMKFYHELPAQRIYPGVNMLNYQGRFEKNKQQDDSMVDRFIDAKKFAMAFNLK